MVFEFSNTNCVMIAFLISIIFHCKIVWNSKFNSQSVLENLLRRNKSLLQFFKHFSFWKKLDNTSPQCEGLLRGQSVQCRQNRANLNILSSWILHNGPPDTKKNFQPKILTSDVMSSFFCWYWAYLSWELLFSSTNVLL